MVRVMHRASLSRAAQPRAVAPLFAPAVVAHPRRWAQVTRERLAPSQTQRGARFAVDAASAISCARSAFVSWKHTQCRGEVSSAPLSSRAITHRICRMGASRARSQSDSYASRRRLSLSVRRVHGTPNLLRRARDRECFQQLVQVFTCVGHLAEKSRAACRNTQMA